MASKKIGLIFVDKTPQQKMSTTSPHQYFDCTYVLSVKNYIRINKKKVLRN